MNYKVCLFVHILYSNRAIGQYELVGIGVFSRLRVINHFYPKGEKWSHIKILHQWSHGQALVNINKPYINQLIKILLSIFKNSKRKRFLFKAIKMLSTRRGKNIFARLEILIPYTTLLYNHYITQLIFNLFTQIICHQF